MSKCIKLLCKDKFEILPPLEAVRRLKEAPFGVFLSFIDPRTNTYIDKTFPFFYESVNTYGLKGRCFVSAWNGMNLYIPADLDWFIEGQQSDSGSTKVFLQDLGFLYAGSFVNKPVKIEVSTYIRVGVEFDIAFLPLLSPSGHGGLATLIEGDR